MNRVFRPGNAPPRRRAWHRLALLITAAVGCATPLDAQDVMAASGDWEYGADSELAAASTRNVEGSLFGLLCHPDCIGFIESARPCEPGRFYDAVMSSPGRADPLRLECRPLEGRYALLFTPNEAFIETLGNGPEVTVTLRLGDDADTVFRFSLNGAYDAVYVTLATAIAAESQTPVSAEPSFLEG